MPFVIVRGAGDVQHQAGKPDLDGPVVTQKLKGELSDGAYVIAYRVVSSDGHPIDGEIPFTVKGATPSPTASSEATGPASPEASPAQSPVQSPVQSPAEPVAAEDEATTAFPIWLLVVVGALVGIGVGFLLSARKKKP
jgi:hypothetical protein